MRILSAVIAVAMLSVGAHADVTNPNYLPFGERAATMGNAGLTSPFGEAAYYNPANLTRIGHPSLSVSGSTYFLFDLSASPILVLQGQDQSFEATGFVAIPSTVTSTYKAGDFWLATAILVPDALQYKNRTKFASTDLKVSIIQEKTIQNLWVGGSIAREVADGLSIGLSVFGSNQTETSLSFVRIQGGNPVTVVREQLTSGDVSVFNLNAILGAYYQASPELGLALRLQAPSITLAGSGDVYSSTTQVGTNPGATEVEISDVNVARPTPTDIAVGAVYHPSDTIELVTDVGLQLPAEITTQDDPRTTTTTRTLELALRVGIGAEITVGNKKWLRLGAMYNGSAVASPQSSADSSSDTYFGLTAGFSFQKKQTVTSFGVFAMQSNTELFVEGAVPERLSDARTRLYGGLLSVSYRL